MDLSSIATHIAETIRESGRVQAVFGEPISLGATTIVPVAAVLANVGGGAGGLPLIGGGGGGLNLRVIPLGYIHEADGAPRFTPIDLPPELTVDRRAARAKRRGWIARMRQGFVKAARERDPSGG